MVSLQFELFTLVLSLMLQFRIFCSTTFCFFYRIFCLILIHPNIFNDSGVSSILRMIGFATSILLFLFLFLICDSLLYFFLYKSAVPSVSKGQTAQQICCNSILHESAFYCTCHNTFDDVFLGCDIENHNRHNGKDQNRHHRAPVNLTV